jgi:hypothetical protein
MRVDDDQTNWFNTAVGVSHGCKLSPLLFKIFLETIMTKALGGQKKTEAVPGAKMLAALQFTHYITFNISKWRNGKFGKATVR